MEGGIILNAIIAGAVGGVASGASGGASSIFNAGTFGDARGILSFLGTEMSKHADDIQIILNSFNNQSIVESFYSSGDFGQDQRERLSELEKALRDYMAVICEGEESLVSQTLSFFDRYEELLRSGK